MRTGSLLYVHGSAATPKLCFFQFFYFPIPRNHADQNHNHAQDMKLTPAKYRAKGGCGREKLLSHHATTTCQFQTPITLIGHGTFLSTFTPNMGY